MSGTYNRAKTRLATGDLNWDDGAKTITAVAVGAGYTFSPDHATLADVVAFELVGDGTRAPVEGRSVAENLTNDRAELLADNSTFPLINAGEIGYVIVFEDIGATDADKHLVCYLSDDGAGAAFALPTNGANVVIAWPGGRVSRID